MDANRLLGILLDCNGNPLFAMVRVTANQEKVIPKNYRHLIPSEDTMVYSLISTPLPTILSALNLLRPVESCIVCESPNWTKDQLKTVQVPLEEWLKALDGAIVDGWLKGACSIEHLNNPKIWFPLWVGTFWTALLRVIEQQKEWCRAQEWTLTLTQSHETHEVQAALERIP